MGVVGDGRDGRRGAKRRRRKDAGAERNRTFVGGVRVGDESDKNDARRHLFRADEGRFGRDLAKVPLRPANRKTPPPDAQTLPSKDDR